MPSKKFIIVTLTILLAGAGIFGLIKIGKLGEGNKNAFQGQKDYILSIFQQNKNDSDNDGLADWEEVLWKTDPNNPDTDKDGTLDGEEVKLRRNPALAGPDDLYFPEKFSESATADLEQITETERFSRNFLSQYLSLKLGSEGEKLSEEVKEELINSLISNINSGVQSASYTLSDIRVLSDNSQEAIKNYGNQLGSIVKQHLNPAPSTEIYTFKEAVEKNDENKFKEIGESVKTYEGLINNCLELPVPSEIKDPYLKFINSLVLLKDITIRFQNFPNDPMGGWIAAEQYADALTETLLQSAIINDFFKNKGIIFSKDEDGYFIQKIFQSK